jgi:hypothetical protein
MEIDRDKIRERVEEVLGPTTWMSVATDTYSLSEVITEGVLAVLDELGSQADRALVIPLPPKTGDIHGD